MLLRLVIATSLILVACEKRPTAETPKPVEARRETTTTSPSSGAKPSINARYLDPKLDVGVWVKRFEGESREVSANRSQILAAVGLRPGQAVADVGAGTGLFMPLFAKAVGPRGKVYAIDISPRFLDHLRERAKKAGHTNVSVVHGKSDSIELPKSSVDLVFICDTYHHFEKPGASLASIHKALRPGGSLVIIDFLRIKGKTREWIMNHVRAGKHVVRKEIEAAGFSFAGDLKLPGLKENYAIRFNKK